MRLNFLDFKFVFYFDFMEISDMSFDFDKFTEQTLIDFNQDNRRNNNQVLEDYFGPINQDNLTADSVNCNLSGASYNTIAAAGNTNGAEGSITGAMTVNLTDVSAKNFYGLNSYNAGGIKLSGTLNMTAESSVFDAIFVGGLGHNSASGIIVKLSDTTINEAFYGNGMSDNSDSTVISFDNVVANGYIFGGSTGVNTGFTVGDITMTFTSGEYNAQVYGGSRVYSTGAADVSGTVDGKITLNLNGGTFNNYVFGGGSGICTSADGQSSATAIVQNGVTVKLAGALINHELYAGGLGSPGFGDGTATGSAIVYNGTSITATCGEVINLYGGGYNYGGGSIVEGGVEIALTGLGFGQGTKSLVIGTVYGGGKSTGNAGSSIVRGGTHIIVGGGRGYTMNTTTITNIYGGGNGANTLVEGGSRITFSGNYSGNNSSKLKITGIVSGNGRNGGIVNGDRVLEFKDFQGVLDARFMDFDRLSSDGYTMSVFARETDFSSLSAIDFDFSASQPINSSDCVLEFASGVTFSDNLVISLAFDARAAVDSTYILIRAENLNTNLNGIKYEIADSIHGDSFSGMLGDGTVWNYYGYNISMELVETDSLWELQLVCREDIPQLNLLSDTDFITADTGSVFNNIEKNQPGMLA